MVLQQEIGLNSRIEEEFLTLGIREILVVLISLKNLLYLKKRSKASSKSFSMMCQVALKKRLLKPSRPGALLGLRLKKDYLIVCLVMGEDRRLMAEESSLDPLKDSSNALS